LGGVWMARNGGVGNTMTVCSPSMGRQTIAFGCFCLWLLWAGGWFLGVFDFMLIYGLKSVGRRLLI